MKFNLKSALSPDTATMVGLLTAGGVYLIYNNAMPNTTDIRMASPHNESIESERKHAAIVSVALIGVVFLVAKDLNSYIISGASLIAIDYMHKHANAVHPATNRLDTSNDGRSIAPGLSVATPMADYSETA